MDLYEYERGSKIMLFCLGVHKNQQGYLKNQEGHLYLKWCYISEKEPLNNTIIIQKTANKGNIYIYISL